MPYHTAPLSDGRPWEGAPAPTTRSAGIASCWGILAPPTHRHLTIHEQELLLMPPDPSGLAAPITVLPPHPKVRRTALPAAALPHLLAGWLDATPHPHSPHTPTLYLLRTHPHPNAARPLRHAEGARWTAFGHTLRQRGDALLVMLPATPLAAPEATS
ncbi:MAG: hypothetical protein KJT01_06350 [Gemmatimonadetes bacterium]|nr:hypothetical protein [Gemmatimonadota bacterium]